MLKEFYNKSDHTDSVHTVVALEAGRWEADGLISVVDVERLIGLQAPAESNANTLAGLFMERLGRIPHAGDAIMESGFRLVVETVDAGRVGKVLIERLSALQHDERNNPDQAQSTPRKPSHKHAKISPPSAISKR